MSDISTSNHRRRAKVRGRIEMVPPAQRTPSAPPLSTIELSAAGMRSLPRPSAPAQEPAPLDLARNLVVGEQRTVAPLRNIGECVRHRASGPVHLQGRVEAAEL